MGIEEVRRLVDNVLADRTIRGNDDADTIRRLKAEILKDRQLDAQEMAELERLFASPDTIRKHLRAQADPVSEAVRDLFSGVEDRVYRQRGADVQALQERLHKLQSFLEDRPFSYLDEPLSEERIEAGEWDADKARKQLEELQKEGKLGRINYQGVPEEEKLAVQYFLQKIASSDRSFHSESDLVVPTRVGAAEPRACYTFRIDEFGNATVTRVGSYQPPAVPDAWSGKTAREAAGELGKTYGIVIEPGRFKFWEKEELAVLKTALERLTPEEREHLKGTVFVRREEYGTRAGDHETDEKGRTVIAIYDLAFKSDRLHFVGDRGDPDSLRTVLHEMGHAMAGNETIRELERKYEAAREEQRLVYNEEYVPAYNAWLRNKSDPAARKRKDEALEKNNAAVEKGEKILEEKHRTEESTFRDFIETFRHHPRLTDYARRNRGDWGEFFAEAYSLYKTEPQLLQDEYPELYDYFKSGKHLK